MTSISTSNSGVQIEKNDRLRPKEAALIARVSVGMIYRWLKEGQFRIWAVTRRGFQRGVRYID